MHDEPNKGLDAAALRVLVDNHERFLRFLARRIEPREVAEEILQDAFVRSIDKGSTLRDGESATAWFYRMLRNALVDHYRRRGAEKRALEVVAREPEPVEAAPDDEMMTVVCACVGSLIQTLKPEYREVLERVEMNGASVQSFAEEAGITANNAGVRVHRAREALRKQLAKSCGTCATHGCLDCHCSKDQASTRC